MLRFMYRKRAINGIILDIASCEDNPKKDVIIP